MTENDFMVAIQAVLTKARDEGWPIERVVDAANEAINEFEVEEEDKQANDRQD
jgi:hypothetical protein